MCISGVGAQTEEDRRPGRFEITEQTVNATNTYLESTERKSE
jgi:hypothetical protein